MQPAPIIFVLMRDNLRYNIIIKLIKPKEEAMRILVVEDDQMIREGISEYLSEFGYTIIEAGDGKEALEKFNNDINLVILDIQIPYINGLEVLREIRRTSKLAI